MSQVVLAAPGHVAVTEAQVPTPAPGEILVRTNRVGICGSDLHALAGEHPFISLPVVPGHEAVGVVATAAADGTGPPVGARVLVEPNLVCGHCRYCTSGRFNLCEHLKVVGCQTPGAMAEYFSIPAGRVRIAPDSLSDAQVITAEPTATAVHAVRSVGELTGRNVAVLGAGTVGLLTMQVAMSAGAAKSVVTDMREAKRDLATRLGATAALSPTAHDMVARARDIAGGVIDVVFDCVGIQASVDQAIALARKGGTVVVVGVPVGPVSIDLPIVQDEEVRIQGSAMYISDDVSRALDLISSDRVSTGELVTATYPLREAAAAFDAARSGDEIKVHITVERR